MIGVLIFTHGDLCNILRIEAQRLTGDREQVRCVSMHDGESLDELTARVRDVFCELDQGDGVLALVDVVGGTPWNVCGQIRSDGAIRIQRVGGGGMPLIIKALLDHGEHTDLDTWAQELAVYATSRVAAG